MALENLEPATRIESILDGEDIAPATRLEYFLKQAGSGSGGGSGTALYIQVVSGAPGEPEHLNRTYDEIDTAITNEQAIMVKTAGVNSFLFLLYATHPLPNKYIVKLFDVGDQIVLNYTSDTADGQLVLAEEEP